MTECDLELKSTGSHSPLSQASAATLKTQQLGNVYARRSGNDGGAGENGGRAVKAQ